MRYLILIFIFALLAGCVNQPRNFKPAGFDTWDEALPYVGIKNYLAANLSAEDWKAFYKRFPEYWNDLQTAKSIAFIGDVNEIHPAYTAYNWRWTTLNRKKPTWSAEKTQRLESGSVLSDDTPFEIFYAKGAPNRIIWDNDFEILIYKPDTAIMLKAGKLKEIKDCPGCWEAPTNTDDDADEFSKSGMHEWDILAALDLKRPTYTK